MARMAGVAHRLCRLGGASAPATSKARAAAARDDDQTRALAAFGFGDRSVASASTKTSSRPKGGADAGAKKHGGGVYPIWYDLRESLADNVSSDSDVAPDHESARRRRKREAPEHGG